MAGVDEATSTLKIDKRTGLIVGKIAKGRVAFNPLTVSSDPCLLVNVALAVTNSQPICTLPLTACLQLR